MAPVLVNNSPKQLLLEGRLNYENSHIFSNDTSISF